MSQHEDNKTVKKTNPRSTGEISEQLYSKQSDEVALEGEARELERCKQESLHTEHIFTAELVSFEKEQNILSTKRIQGNELFLTLWNPTSLLGKIRGKKLQDVETIASRMEELGCWLSLYHRSSLSDEINTKSVEWLHESALSKIKGICDNNLLPNKKINKIEQRLLSGIEQLSKPEYCAENNIKHCRIHGDFIIYNMLIDAKKDIHIIDFGDTRLASNIDDVARFYSNLWAIAHTNHWRKSLFMKIANNFLAAYGLDSKIVDTPYFKTMMTYNFLIHLYGQFCMRDLLSFISMMELNQVTKAGLKWIDKNYI